MAMAMPTPAVRLPVPFTSTQCSATLSCSKRHGAAAMAVMAAMAVASRGEQNFGVARTPRAPKNPFFRRKANAVRDASMETVLAALHPSLAVAVREALNGMPPEAKTLLIGPKEEIGGVKGVPLQRPDDEPCLLRGLPQDCYDLVVEVQSEEVRSVSWEAVQNRFYPLGGHSFSLANDFIINLASISKVLRSGGKFLFLSMAKSQDEVLPFAFLNLPHLQWHVHMEAAPTGKGCADTADVSVVSCTMAADATSETLKLTPRVVAQQCTDEISRRRYFEALRPFLKREGKAPRILDYGCGDGSLMSWALDPQVEALDGSCDITLVEANSELVSRAQAKLPNVDIRYLPEGEPWPFDDLHFDVVVLAFVLHHVPMSERAALLAEAQRVGRSILVLEDLPDEAGSIDAQRLAWLVTEEHFRPFGQDPDDFISGVLSRQDWAQTFRDAGLEILQSEFIGPSLRYPVPHILFRLK